MVGIACAIGCGHAPRAGEPAPAPPSPAPSTPSWPPQREPPVPVAVPAPVSEPSPAPDAPDTREPARPAPRDHYEARAPGVRVREGESQGIGFLEVVLGDADPHEPLPMVFVIHGRGDRPRVPGEPFGSLAHPVRLILPRGPMIVGEGFGWLPVRVLEGRTELLAAGLRDVAARLARMIDALRAERPTLGPTLVSGFSQGGMLAITLAVRSPGSVGMAFPLAGWLPPPLWPEGPPPPGAPPIRAMHARDDERIPYGPTLEGYERLRTLGWQLELATYEGVGHSMSDEMNAALRAWLDEALGAITSGGTQLSLPAPPVEAVEEEESEPRVRARARRPRRERPRQERPRRSRPPRRPRRR